MSACSRFGIMRPARETMPQSRHLPGVGSLNATHDRGRNGSVGARLRVESMAVLGCVVGLLAALGAEAANVFLGSNLHTVIPGKVYRCAQCSGKELEGIVHRLGIETVVNLRGSAVSLPWYTEESRATHRLNVCQEDIALSAARLPSVHEIRRLIEVLDAAQYPILLHCRHGADRTGLGVDAGPVVADGYAAS